MDSVLQNDIVDRLAARMESLLASWPINGLSIPDPNQIIATRRIIGYYDCLAQDYIDTQKHLTTKFGAGVCDAFNRCVLIKMLLSFALAPNLPKTSPPWLRQSFVEKIELIAERVLNAPEGEYAQNSDPLIKDIRVLGGVSFPMKHNVVDWHAYLPRTFYRHRGWKENVRAFWFVTFRAGGLGPYLRNHIDPRLTEVRRQTSQEVQHRMTAEVLESCPHILGSVSNSWLSDPALEWVSPRHWARDANARVLRSFFRRDGYTEVDLERALSTSKRRRQLYEEGKYRPCSCTTIILRERYLEFLYEKRREDANADAKQSR